MKPLSQVNKRYRQILIASLMSSGSLLPLLPALADPLLSTAPQNSAAPGVIENQATAEFTDSADSTVVPIVSDIVKVEVAEIAGISAGGAGVNSLVVGTAPTLYPTSTAYFDFKVFNQGNDPTKLFIPAAPSVATVNGSTTGVVIGQLQIINYNTVDAAGNYTPTAANTLVDQTTGTATDSVRPGGYVTVRVPITIPFGTPRNAPIVVTLGNTPTAPIVGAPVNNMPYVASGITTGNNDLLTQDNTTVSATTGESNTTAPFNNEREASATQTALVKVPKIVISGKVYDDADNTAVGTFANIQNGAEAGAIIPNTTPLYALLIDSTGKVIGNSLVISNGTNGTTGTNGTYSFTDIDGYQNGLKVVLSTTNVTVGTTPTPAAALLLPSLPLGWEGTSPLTYTPFNVGGDTATELLTYLGKDFGIELLPNAVGATASSKVNPVGVNLFDVPATVFTGSTDPDPNATGAVAAYKITAFPTNAVTITINGTTYTPTSFAAAVTATGGVSFTLAELNAGAVKVDPIDGASTVDIPFKAIDNAGKLSLNTSNGLLPFSADAVTISGTVYNDRDKSATATFTNIKPNTTAGVDDTGTDTLVGTNSTPIYATLYNTDTNKVIATQVIPNTGIYSFSGITATTNVKVILSTTAGTPGSATAPTAGLPGGWNGTTVQDSGVFNTGNYGTNVNLGGFAPKDFGVIQKARFVIVKRITKINGTSITGTAADAIDSWNFGVTNNTAAPAHTAPTSYLGNWPAGYLVGATDAGKVKPGDIIEYTIYFLNNQGADAKSIKICDPIRGSQNYVAGSTSLRLGANATDTSLADLAPHVTPYSAGNAPSGCNIAPAQAGDPGVAINITSDPAVTDRPAGIPGAVNPANPSNTTSSYGLFRFRTQVKP
jgi:hypothetical protein